MGELCGGLPAVMGNSAAATAAAQTNQYYMSKLGEMVPELAQQAYERYADSYNTDINLLENMLDTFTTPQPTATHMEPTTKLFLISTQFSLQIQTETKRHMKSIGTHFLTNKKYDKNEQDYRWTEANNSQDYNWNEVLNGQESTQKIIWI